MRTRDLEFLQSLARTGSVSETARVLHTTQSNASKVLKRLEDHFGFQIFERVKGRLVQTEEGRLIAEQAEESLISLRQLDARARNLREMRHVSLTVGATPQLSRDLVPNAVAELMLAYPSVAASIYTRNSRALIDLVSQRRLDFAIGLLPVEDSNVDCLKLFDVELMAALRRDHALCAKEKLRPSDFDGQDFITTSMLDRSREQLDGFFRKGDARPVERGEASLSYTRLRLVEHGLGVTMVDSLAAREYRGDRIEFRPLDDPPYLSVWLMKSKLQRRSKVGDAFARFIEEHAKALPRLDV